MPSDAPAELRAPARARLAAGRLPAPRAELGRDRADLADTDDAMRLAQLRDWLAGQGWYD